MATRKAHISPNKYNKHSVSSITPISYPTAKRRKSNLYKSVHNMDSVLHEHYTIRSAFRTSDNKEMDDPELLSNATKIEHGIFSKLYHVTDSSNNSYVIKHILPIKYNIYSAIREVDNLVVFHDNPHIVKIIGANIYNDEAYIVYKYIDGETLYDWLRSFPTPTSDARKHIIDQLDIAVNSIHEHGYAHLDLHPRNIWISKDDHLIILDLGSMYTIGSIRNVVTTAGKYSPGIFSAEYNNITQKKATVRLNEYAMRVIRQNILKFKKKSLKFKNSTRRKKHRK
jgi:serine/threonine protein kinase